MHRYPELLASSSAVESFVRALYGLLGGGQRSGIAYDGLVSQSLRFWALQSARVTIEGFSRAARQLAGLSRVW